VNRQGAKGNEDATEDDPKDRLCSMSHEL
jgi:hypothetical protein